MRLIFLIIFLFSVNVWGGSCDLGYSNIATIEEYIEDSQSTGNSCPHNQPNPDEHCNYNNSTHKVSVTTYVNTCVGDNYGGNGTWYRSIKHQQFCEIGYTFNESENICTICDINESVPTPPTDANYTEIYNGEVGSAPTQCYEAVDPFFASDYISECIEKKICWQKSQTPYNCDELGENWEYNSAQTAQTCSDWVGNGYDSANFLTSDTNAPTCCLHSPEDPNDTTPSPSPTPDNNDTNPSPTHDPDVDCSNYDPCIAPYFRNVDDCGCHIDSTPDPSPTPTDGGGGGTSTTDNILNGIQSDINSASASADAKADETNQKLSETNAILSAIKADSISQSDKNHDDLYNVKHSVDVASAKNHDDLGKIDETLGGIKEGTDSLKDLINEGKTTAKDSKDSALNSMNDAIANAQNANNSILDSLNVLVSSYTNTPPTFTGSGDSSFSFTVFNKTVNLDFSMVANLRQYFDIVFLIMLAYLNFRIYLYIFNLLLKLGV